MIPVLIISEKEAEKVQRYQKLRREIAKTWDMRTVQVIYIIVQSLGSVTKTLDNWVEKLNIIIILLL